MRWNIVIGIATAVCALIQLVMTAVGYFNPDGLSAGFRRRDSLIRLPGSMLRESRASSLD
jgi:hypothetical protein